MAEPSNFNVSGTGAMKDSKPVTLAPLTESGRIASLDILRGFAVLGILVINISMFALPSMSQQNPLAIGGTDSLNLGVWVASQLFFYQKFMTIFAMLFGAGLVLMYERFHDSESSFRTVYLRRMRWLIVIGLAHAYLLWWGDILFFYGLCGMLVFLFRRLSPRRLIVFGFIIAFATVPLMFGLSELFSYAKQASVEAEAAREAGQEVTAGQARFSDMWREISAGFAPSPEELQKEINEYQGDIGTIFARRAKDSFMAQTAVFFFYGLWRVCGMMLIGMGLMKLGFFSGQWSLKTYGIALAIGYGLGFSLSGWGMYSVVTSGYDAIVNFRVMGIDDYIGSIFIALGHMCVLLIVVKTMLYKWLTDRLGAVGRMALSNYLFHSIVFTTVFYGFGLSLYGQLDRITLVLMVVAMWGIQLYASPIWFRYFRFGPVEWVWRALTYRMKPSMRVDATS